MRKQLCLICGKGKDIGTMDGGICATCIEVSCCRCKSAVKTIQSRYCVHCHEHLRLRAKLSVEEMSIGERDELCAQLVIEIGEVASRKNIREVAGFGMVDFEPYALVQAYTIGELETLLEALMNMGSEPVYIISSMDVLEQYPYGVEKKKKICIDDGSWRKQMPRSLQYLFPKWRTCTLEEVYKDAKIKMGEVEGKQRQDLRIFIAEMSQLIFERQEEGLEKEISDDDYADALTDIIEMILLPYLHMQEEQEKGAQIMLLEEEGILTESLKHAVKQRDSWMCVVCKSDVNLHVHHRIPRNVGGPHHIENLVTLCSFCHKAMETRSISTAFQMCWKQYKRGNIEVNVRKDKKHMQQEMEQVLEVIRIRLEKKHEYELAQSVEDVQRMMEEILSLS